MKTAALLTIIILFFFSITVPAQAALLPSPGLTPDSPFYFFDGLREKVGLFFAFGAERKAEKAIKYASEKLAEANVMAEKNKIQDTETANQNYEKFLNIANVKTKEAKEKGEDVENLATLITETILEHQEILLEVFEEIPEEAKNTIERTIKVSRQGSEEAVQTVSGDNKEALLQKINEINVRSEEKTKILEEKLTKAEERIKELEKKLKDQEQKTINEIEIQKEKIEKIETNDLEEQRQAELARQQELERQKQIEIEKQKQEFLSAAEEHIKGVEAQIEENQKQRDLIYAEYDAKIQPLKDQVNRITNSDLYIKCTSQLCLRGEDARKHNENIIKIIGLSERISILQDEQNRKLGPYSNQETTQERSSFFHKAYEIRPSAFGDGYTVFDSDGFTKLYDLVPSPWSDGWDIYEDFW